MLASDAWPVFAQEAATVLASATFSHISLNVSNFDNMLDWYIKKLGFALETQGKSTNLGGKKLAYIRLNDCRLELVEADEDAAHAPQFTKISESLITPGWGHLCLRVEDLDVAVVELTARGLKPFVKAQTYTLEGTPYERRAAFFKDPEGNLIEFGEAADIAGGDNDTTPDKPSSKKKK